MSARVQQQSLDFWVSAALIRCWGKTQSNVVAFTPPSPPKQTSEPAELCNLLSIMCRYTVQPERLTKKDFWLFSFYLPKPRFELCSRSELHPSLPHFPSRQLCPIKLD